MENQTFEDFLQDIHIRLYPLVQDDDLPDHFEKWLGELDGEDYIRWGELHGKQQYLMGKEEALKSINI